MSFDEELKKYPSLEPYISKIKEKIQKEEWCCNLSKETLNSLNECIEKNEGDIIYLHLIQGLALMEKIKENIDSYPKNKEMALEDLKIGQELQGMIKKEIGNFVLKGKKEQAKEIQDFNYKLFEEIGPLRAFEEKEKIEEVEISLTPSKIKEKIEKEKNEMIARAKLLQDAATELKIKKVEKKEKNIGRKILFFLGILVLIGGIYSILNIKKGRPVEYNFNVSEFPELPQDSKIERGNFDLKITVPEEFWEGLDKKKKMEIVNIVSTKAQDKGYLMVSFYIKNGEKIAKWVKDERTYIYK